jgi:hypothetical protein
MNMSRVFSGRKKECDVWRWFEYKADLDKSVCLAIVNDEKEQRCGIKLAGKNPTNLKVKKV